MQIETLIIQPDGLLINEPAGTTQPVIITQFIILKKMKHITSIYLYNFHVHCSQIHSLEREHQIGSVRKDGSTHRHLYSRWYHLLCKLLFYLPFQVPSIR